MPLVTVFGGSGFIGRYAARKLAKRGWRVKVAVRRPNEAVFLRPYGDVGQIEPVQANIRDEASTTRAVEGADAVLNLVGILFETSRQNFDAVQHEGAGRVARLAREAGAGHMVQMSAIGADPDSPSDYASAKGRGEQAVRREFPGATVLRPSIVFGPEDGFFNRFAGIARLSPVLPVVGGDTRFQPVYVDDVAAALVAALEKPEAQGQVYELGGPEVATMRELMAIMLDVIRRKRALVDLPMPVARLQAWFLEKLPSPMLTRDQLLLLEQDNVVAEGAKTLADLGIEPTAMEAVLDSYLYRFRPYGQYARNAPMPGEVG